MKDKINKNIVLSKEENEDLISYCKLNNLEESQVLKRSYVQGYQIEKYGLLSGSQKPIIQEVIKEIEVEKLVEVVKEVPVEKIIEIVKEVPAPPIEVIVKEYVDREVIKEVPVEKVIKVSDDEKINDLLLKIQELENRPPKIIEILKEVPIEVVKEIRYEKKTKMLEETLHNLRLELLEKEKKIKDLESKFSEYQKNKLNLGAIYLRGSNLDETLFK